MEARTEERRSVVASGKTVEDAVKNGLTMLGVRRDQVDLEVISEGSRGVLGFGAENARVRLIVKPTLPPKPSEPVQPPVTPQPVKKEQAAPQVSGGVPASVVEATPKQFGRPPARRDEGGPKGMAPVPVPEPGPESRKPGAEEAGRDILRELLGLMGIQATVEIRWDSELADEGQPPPAVLNLTGDDLGILIGRRGETLRSLQYLLRLMVSHRVRHWTNLIVDVEGFRVRRRRALQNLAQRVAEEVARSGRSQALEPMPPDERRVVHMALRSHPRVTTQSVGEGERRRVTIIPKR